MNPWDQTRPDEVSSSCQDMKEGMASWREQVTGNREHPLTHVPLSADGQVMRPGQGLEEGGQALLAEAGEVVGGAPPPLPRAAADDARLARLDDVYDGEGERAACRGFSRLISFNSTRLGEGLGCCCWRENESD